MLTQCDDLGCIIVYKTYIQTSFFLGRPFSIKGPAFRNELNDFVSFYKVLVIASSLSFPS
jgi:hypothetical protein